MTKTEHISKDSHDVIEHEPPSTVSKIITIVLYGALVLAAIGIGIFLYWSFQDEQVLSVNNSPVPVRTIRKHPTADGVIILKVDFCKHTSATGRVRTSFVSDSREIFLPVAEDKQGETCEVREVPILIPHETPPDTYKIKFRIDYKVNPIKNSIEEFESLPFEVRE